MSQRKITRLVFILKFADLSEKMEIFWLKPYSTLMYCYTKLKVAYSMNANIMQISSLIKGAEKTARFA